MAVVLVEVGEQASKADLEPVSEAEAEVEAEVEVEAFESVDPEEPEEPLEPDALAETVVPLEPVLPVLPVEAFAPACPASVKEPDAADETVWDTVEAPSSRAPSALLQAVSVRVTVASAAAARRRVRSVRADM